VMFARPIFVLSMKAENLVLL